VIGRYEKTVIDCPDPRALAKFYCQVLGMRVDPALGQVPPLHLLVTEPGVGRIDQDRLRRLPGATRFADFRNDLGIAADILTSRLADLVDEGLMEKRPYREPGARMRYSYHLTPAGEQLRLVLAALQQWGDENRPPIGGPSTLRRSADRGRPVSVRCRYSHPAEQRAVHPRRLGPTLKQPSGLGLAI
jgi:DNA-binding HxlR family transcriptional regulator